MLSIQPNLRSNDRVLILEALDGVKPKSAAGLTDPRLFTGENKVHVKMDPRTTHWSFSYEMGIIPGALRGTFTSFKAALKHAELYFRGRNLKIKEIID